MVDREDDLEIEIDNTPDEDIEVEGLEDKVSSTKSNDLEDDDNPFDNDEDDEDGSSRKTKVGRAARQKRNYKERISRMEAENRILRQSLEVLRERTEGVNQKTEHLNNLARQFTQENLDNKIKELEGYINYYDTESFKSSANGDAEKASQQNLAKRQFQNELEKYKLQKTQFDHSNAPQNKNMPREQDLSSHPRTVQHQQSFLKKYPWFLYPEDNYDIEDASLVKELDREVFAEGYNMTTPAYWKRLEEKVHEALPDRFEKTIPQATAPRVKKSAVTSTVNNTNSSGDTARTSIKIDKHLAEVLVRRGYMAEDRKTILNKDKVRKFYQDYQKAKERNV